MAALRRRFSLEDKRKFLEQYDQLPKLSLREAASRLSIAPSLLWNILNKRSMIVNGEETSRKPRVSCGKAPRLEANLWRWIDQSRQSGSPVTDLIIHRKAAAVAARMGMINFRPSPKWYSSFKQREALVRERYRIYPEVVHPDQPYNLQGGPYKDEEQHKLQDELNKLQDQSYSLQEQPYCVQGVPSKLQDQPKKLQDQPKKLQDQPKKLPDQLTQLPDQLTQLQDQPNKRQDQPNNLRYQPYSLQDRLSRLQCGPDKVQVHTNDHHGQPNKIKYQPYNGQGQSDNLKGQPHKRVDQTNNFQRKTSDSPDRTPQPRKLQCQPNKLQDRPGKLQDRPINESGPASSLGVDPKMNEAVRLTKPEPTSDPLYEQNDQVQLRSEPLVITTVHNGDMQTIMVPSVIQMKEAMRTLATGLLYRGFCDFKLLHQFEKEVAKVVNRSVAQGCQDTFVA